MVATETPACAATSLMLTRPCEFGLPPTALTSFHGCVVFPLCGFFVYSPRRNPALKTNLRMGPIAERLRRRAAAAAQHAFEDRDGISLGVGEREIAVDDVRAVI